MDEISIRQAVPTDAPLAAPLIYSSGPAGFDYVFLRGKKEAVTFLRFSFARGKALFGYRNHAVAIHQGKVVGTIAYYTHEDMLRLNAFTAIDILRFYGPVTGTSVILQGLHLERFIRPPSRGRLYLGHIGVDPALRSKGIGKALIEHAITTHPKSAIYIPALDVAFTNPRAQALYERLGFTVFDERAAPAPSVPAHRYMEKAK